MPSLDRRQSARTSWRSLDELAQTPEFQQMVSREFPNDSWDTLPPATRRQFLKVMGASLALAGLTACRWPEEEIVPFAHRPEDRVPGEPRRFATSYELGGAAFGLLLTSNDGRPTKVEGNPLHPDSLGAATAQLQATVLEVWDPDRSRTPVERRSGQSVPSGWTQWDAFAGDHFAELRKAGGRGLAVLAEPSSSPTLARLRSRLREVMPEAAWIEYQAISRDAEREATRMAFGRPLRLIPRLDRARVVACIDADPLVDHPAAVALARQFAGRRQPDPARFNRLWVAEGGYTSTGAVADHRLALAASAAPRLLAELARELESVHGITLPREAAGLAKRTRAVRASETEHAFIAGLARDLAAARGEGVILVGTRQPPAAIALSLALNHALGNIGAGVALVEDPEPDRPTHLEAIAQLARRLEAGEVGTLVVIGGNPAYDAPADLKFADAIAKAATVVRVSLTADETAALANWHLPMAHAYEAWGDGRAWDGTLTLRQPLIEPLYGGRSDLELVAALLGEAKVKGYDLVRTTHLSAGGPDFERWWRRALHDGVVDGTAWSEVTRAALDPEGLDAAATAYDTLLTAPGPSAQAPELVLVADPRVRDGRFANLGWLQELPDAFTKITWDNALLASPATARELGLADGEVVAVSSGGVSVELPLYVVPGAARYCLTASLGYGRTRAGEVGTGVGVDLYPMRTTARPHLLTSVSVRGTGRRERLATTQDHFAIDRRGFEARNLRIGELAREASLDEYLADPEVIHHEDHHPPLVSLWREHTYEGEQWGMAIDLGSCIGCNACIVACQAENNIPVVGRQQVINQREMQWIRLDRYFRTPEGLGPDEVDDAEVAFQPVACVQCEMAPCEQVCPVAATQHTNDGLNAMVYNRCVGTRYCSNNCPFKVRRFNFFNYHKHLTTIEQMQYNPDVTVRSRGVMEKCTYCVQRIEAVRITAKNDRRPIADGEIVPACAQTCPSRAIVFGNLNDPTSEVARLREDHRAYATLAELNIKPRTHYLARLRNPAGGAGHHGEESA